MQDEKDLHFKVVDFIRRFYPKALVVAGLGEMQSTSGRRIESYRKDFQKGQPDIIIQNLHINYSGLCIELKTPKGGGRLSDSQSSTLKSYEDNNYKCLISNDYDHIITSIIEYMRGISVKCKYCSRMFKSNESLRSHHKYFHRKKHTL